LNGLPPETIAVAFAKSSRSPEPFDQIAKELNDQKSSEFHEKWVVGYGHSSVAEHAVLSLAIENVSILATKVLEDNRLASYTEKSTRYQTFDKTKYYKPANVMASTLGKLYESTADYLLDSYLEMIDAIIPFLKKKYPRTDQPERLYEIQIKNKALDNIRYVLPIATLTNLGMTANARALEHAAVKLLSHPLQEMKEIGEELKAAAMSVTPTLIKYVKPNQYLMGVQECCVGVGISESEEGDVSFNEARLASYDKDAPDRVIAGILYRFSEVPYETIMKKVKTMSHQEREAIIDKALSGMEKYDAPIRELELVNYTFDILMDYGAFRDIQRHRMATQVNQAVTPKHGYCVPEEVVEAGLEARYRSCMKKAETAYDSLCNTFKEEAQYIIPLAYRKRTLFVCNLRELYHFIKLRSGKQGHVSYRRIAQQMYREVKKVHPLLTKHMNVDLT